MGRGACLCFDLCCCGFLFFGFFCLSSMKEFPDKKDHKETTNYFPFVENNCFIIILTPSPQILCHTNTEKILFLCWGIVHHFFNQRNINHSNWALWFNLGLGWEREREVILDFNEEAFSIWRATCLLQDLQYHEQCELVFKKMRFFSQASVSKTSSDASCEAILSYRKPGSLHQILIYKASGTAVFLSLISQKQQITREIELNHQKTVVPASLIYESR